jgi:sigma-54-dependent transcriptional regulator
MSLVSAMAAAPDRGRAAQLCLDAAITIAQAEAGRLYALDATNTHLVLTASSPPSRGVEAPIPLYPNGTPKMDDPRTYCAFSGEMGAVPDAQHAGLWDLASIHARDAVEGMLTRGVLTCPLQGNNDVTVGVLEISGLRNETGQKLDEAGLRARGSLLQAFAYQAAIHLAHRALEVRNEVLSARLEQMNEEAGTADEQDRTARMVATSATQGLIQASPQMRAMLDMLTKVVDSTVPVLILGETGTGKDVIARLVHAGSGRSGAYVAQNCAALPAELLESELFGHRRGAFTGAHADKAGLFEQADQGTLFLDEIGDMPLGLQAKLLRVLQDGEVRALGATKARRLDVRILAATHADLRGDVADGLFREDLYYRLAVFPVTVPPLRDRDGDTLLLARHFAHEFARTYRKHIRGMTPDTERLIVTHPWPGNVRELRNVMERAVILCPQGSEVLPDHLPSEMLSARLPSGPAAGPGGELRQAVERTEVERIEQALRTCGGNVTQAARLLGLGRRTFYEKMARYGIGRAGAVERMASGSRITAQS